MSRPALYQYFENKGDLFACAFAALVEGAADRAVAALDEPGAAIASVDSSLPAMVRASEGSAWRTLVPAFCRG